MRFRAAEKDVPKTCGRLCSVICCPVKVQEVAAVEAARATYCPHWGYQIPPAELRRTSSTQVGCPKCGVTFTTNASA